MFGLFRKVKEKIESEMNECNIGREIEIEVTRKEEESDLFLVKLKSLSELVYPFVDPRYKYSGFREYSTMNEIGFTTRENSITKYELIRLTGLKSLRNTGGWDCDKWEASYREYVSIFENKNTQRAKSVRSAIIAIHTNISINKDEYSNFIFRYTDSLVNICDIIQQYGSSFIFSDNELFESVFSLIGSLVGEYENYTNAIKEYKKNKALEQIKLEQAYITKTIEDNTLMLEFYQKQ